jgi:hypothetical protein
MNGLLMPLLAADDSVSFGGDTNVGLSLLAVIIKLAVMAGAIGILLYRWKAECAPLLFLTAGVFVGFLMKCFRVWLSSETL